MQGSQWERATLQSSPALFGKMKWNNSYRLTRSQKLLYFIWLLWNSSLTLVHRLKVTYPPVWSTLLFFISYLYCIEFALREWSNLNNSLVHAGGFIDWYFWIRISQDRLFLHQWLQIRSPKGLKYICTSAWDITREISRVAEADAYFGSSSINQCQCLNGPKIYNAEPRCRICLHVACSDCHHVKWSQSESRREMRRLSSSVYLLLRRREYRM